MAPFESTSTTGECTGSALARADQPGVRAHVVAQEAAMTMHAGSSTFTVLAELAMLGVGLSNGSASVVVPHRAISDVDRGGHTLGVPLLYPWANRLSSDVVRFPGATVDLSGSPLVSRDPSGLPMHGTMVGRRPFEVRELATRDGVAMLRTGIDLSSDPEHLAVFPFPHDLEIVHELATIDDGSTLLTVTTVVRAGSETAVPVSFGWHPYFTLPGSERDDWVLSMPERDHLELDDQMLPTGEVDREPAEQVALAGKVFDDAYRLVDANDEGRRLRVHDHHLEVCLTSGRGYDFAQVYAPEGQQIVALEPMVAAADSLHTGAHPWVQPGDTFRATFTVSVRQLR